MGFNISLLWKTPVVNPINKKARSIPVLNVVDPYGRVFFFSWMGFMLGFWAWYTFPPLLTVTIKKDLHLSAAEVGNSNIVSLCATLLLRFVAGPLCDQFGSRRVYASLLLLGCLPIGLAPLVKTANGLYVSRFFIGILGATFVPCQVWCTGFFDKNIVGTANALSGGWGNAGGGITYFIMPAVFDSLVASQGMTPSKAWRVTFVVPLICLIACALGMIFLCPDTPLGSWEERSQKLQENLDQYSPTSTTAVNTPHILSEPPSRDEEKAEASDGESKFYRQPSAISLSEAVSIAQAETVVKPSFKDSLPVILSLQTLFHVATYSCSFGGELAVNSILSSYYKANFPHLDQTKASNYAAIFGFLNFVTRPLGGVVADILYKVSGQNLWTKKAWITMAGLLSGALLIVVGKVDPSEANGRDIGTMVGLVTVAAFFIEAGNGANFALVPHVHPAANGVLSGCTGGGGNLGGVVFAIIFRFIDHGSGYATACWVIGVIHIAVNLAVCWIPPLPKRQVGGQ
ncbi:high affinity nitrate transporter NrtB [Metarhizium brunneum]